MHVWFRQYAQQMGMQNVRAILPEQIDVLINTSISYTINELVRTSIGLTNDRVITDNAKIAQINALRNLYTVQEINFSATTKLTKQIAGKNKIRYHYEKLDNDIKNLLYIADFSINYQIDRRYDDNGNPASDKNGNPLYQYRSDQYPVRIIENRFLADSLQDFVLKPTFRSPVAVVTNIAFLNGTETNYKHVVDLYLGSKPNIDMAPFALYVGYIQKPVKVQYLEDVGGTNVNCDLPDYMHADILKHAVDLYRGAIQGSLYANQQQQQAQQREIGRNNVRPDNEGYQQ